MKRTYRMGILGLLVGLLIVTLIFFMRRNENENEVHQQLSKNAQVVRDYLDGREIPGNETWWLNMPFGHDVDMMAAIVSLELKLDEHYVLNQIRPNNFSVVYRPEIKSGKK